jgi:hypothetical protein
MQIGTRAWSTACGSSNARRTQIGSTARCAFADATATAAACGFGYLCLPNPLFFINPLTEEVNSNSQR